jgi:hypothetical protein
MTTEKKKDVMKMPEEQLNKIIGLLSRVQNMTDDEFKKILSMGAGFHNYSLFNKILITIAGGSQVAGYEKWQKLKRQVRKGSKAIKILAPRMSYSIKVGGEWQFTTWKKHKEFNGEKRSFPTAFIAVNVFDIKDTDGEELPEMMTKKSDLKLSQVLQAAEKLGYTVESRPLEYDMGGYIEADKKITLNSNRNEAANVGTLIHEMCHGEMGHTDTNNSHSYELNEQQAESATFLVCQALGVERNSEFYLKSWKMSENILADFQQISSVANKIVRAIEGNAKHFLLADE